MRPLQLRRLTLRLFTANVWDMKLGIWGTKMATRA